jgi:hypothetical protein
MRGSYDHRMSDVIEQVESIDPEIDELWMRTTDEPDIRAVSAHRSDNIGGWQVAVWVMEFVHSDPLEDELRQRITRALQSVTGVTSAAEQDNEKWFVTGTPSGKALVEAAVQVVDDLTERIRAYVAQRRL